MPKPSFINPTQGCSVPLPIIICHKHPLPSSFPIQFRSLRQLPLVVRQLGQQLPKNINNPAHGSHIGLQLLNDLVDVVAELGVKVLAVGEGRYGDRGAGLGDLASSPPQVFLVTRLVCRLVGVGKRCAQLLLRLVEVVLEGLAGELEAAPEPVEALAGGAVLGLCELVLD